MAIVTNDRTMDQTALSTISLLEARLLRIEHLLFGPSPVPDRVPVDSAYQSLESLERRLASLVSQVRVYAELLKICMLSQYFSMSGPGLNQLTPSRSTAHVSFPDYGACRGTDAAFSRGDSRYRTRLRSLFCIYRLGPHRGHFGHACPRSGIEREYSGTPATNERARGNAARTRRRNCRTPIQERASPARMVREAYHRLRPVCGRRGITHRTVREGCQESREIERARVDLIHGQNMRCLLSHSVVSHDMPHWPLLVEKRSNTRSESFSLSGGLPCGASYTGSLGRLDLPIGRDVVCLWTAPDPGPVVSTRRI